MFAGAVGKPGHNFMADAIPGINGSTSTAAYFERVPTQKLDQDDFIKLLVAQLTTQDPLNPQKDTEFIGQMAQFSALESSKSMQTEIQTLRANQLLGQTVEIKLDEEKSLVGPVTAIDSSSSQPKIIVGERAFSLSDVVRVEQASTGGKTV
jgi:flagellar basal-body rod modification protein FlgD